MRAMQNHDGSNDSKTFTIDKAASTTTVTCPASVNYNALPQTPCTATVAGAALSISPTPAYSNNVNAGTATASYNYAGDLNHTASSDSKTFAINKAVLTVKADNKSMLLHAPLPTFTASYSGFKGSDSFANSVTGAPSLTASATSASPVGAYAIAAALGTLAANNYSFWFRERHSHDFVFDVGVPWRCRAHDSATDQCGWEQRVQRKEYVTGQIPSLRRQWSVELERQVWCKALCSTRRSRELSPVP
jgi:hypothetical protein